MRTSPCASVATRFRQEAIVKNFTPMVAKLVWRYWPSLPMAIKVWLDIDDLVMETLSHVVMISLPLYRGSMASMSTFVYMNAEKYMLNTVKKYGCMKRNAPVISIEPADLPMIEPMSLSNLYETRMGIEKVYKLASPLLRHQMRLWFTPPKPIVRKDSQFERSRKEFLRLSSACRLSRQDCRLLLDTGYYFL
jgi:hypothetical protein